MTKARILCWLVIFPSFSLFAQTVTVAVAVLYRYADFVSLLGGTELHLGWIVGIGMVGSLTMRLFVGTRIDHYGPRLVWLSALALLACVCFGHLLVMHYPGANIRDPVVVAACVGLRIAMWCAIAGIYASAMTFIASRVPVVRMAELLGMLGTSGFLGMILGVWVSDLLLSGAAHSAAAVYPSCPVRRPANCAEAIFLQST